MVNLTQGNPCNNLEAQSKTVDIFTPTIITDQSVPPILHTPNFINNKHILKYTTNHVSSIHLHTTFSIFNKIKRDLDFMR